MNSIILCILVLILIIITVPEYYNILITTSLLSLLFFDKYCDNKNKERLTPHNGETKEKLNIPLGNTFGIKQDPPKKKKVDNDQFDNSNLVNDMFSEHKNSMLPSDGDSKLGARMQYIQDQSKQAILHRSRMTSDNYKKYYQEELDSAEKRHWWENDNLDVHLVKDGVNWNNM